MPKMNGVIMLQELRKDVWGKNVPVIVLTNLNESKSISDSMNEKIMGYIIKSEWKLEDIVNKVEEILKIKV